MIALGEDQTLAEIPGLIHEVPTADLDTPALSLLSTIIAHPCHMAVITDQVEENQKTDSALPRRCCGIATLEDVIEQLIGEISDEFDSDRLPRTIKVLGDNSIVVNGGFPMHDLPRIVARELFSIPDDQPIDTATTLRASPSGCATGSAAIRSSAISARASPGSNCSSNGSTAARRSTFKSA